MHSRDASGNSVPAFLTKIWKLVDDPTTDDLICWNESGTSFIIRNPGSFSRELLPLYFKHNNMASFVRQLNMYGFRKIAHLDQGSLLSESEEMEFYHMFFLKGNESLLALIKRKVSTGRMDDGRIKPEILKEVMSNVKVLCEKQVTIDTMLVNTKKENEALWREVAILRQKHMKQQQIIEKLIQFLVSIVQPNRNLGLKRKLPFMIHDGVSSSDSKIPRLARQFSFDRRSGTDFGMSSTATTSKMDHGPVIHDITDSLEEIELMAPGSKLKPQLSGAKTLWSGCPASPTVDSPASPVASANSPLGSPLVSEIIEPLSLLDPLESFPPALSPGAELLGTGDLPDPSLALSLSEAAASSPVPKGSQEDSSLNTPKPDEVSLSSPVNSSASIESLMSILPSSSGQCQPTVSGKRTEEPDLPQDTGDMQVAISEPNTSALTRSNFSEHVENMENELDWLQQHLSGSSLNIDASALLGLFSCDEPFSGNNIVMDNVDTRNLASDSAGKELVQYPSSLFDWDINEDSCPLFDVSALESDNVEPVDPPASELAEERHFQAVTTPPANDPADTADDVPRVSLPDPVVRSGGSKKKRSPTRKK